MDAVLRMHQAMDATIVGPWLHTSLNALDHGCYRGWAMDALVGERI